MNRIAKQDATHIGVADGMRALSIFIIAWYHIWQQSWLEPTLRIGHRVFTLLPLVRTGYLMVDVLLLLSGFLLFLPYARHMVLGTSLPNLRDFYRKRALRIGPSYYFAVFVALFLFALPLGEYRNPAELWTDLLSHLTFTHTFFRWAYLYTKLNVVLWTLAIEVQAYLLFPWMARFFVKRPLLGYVALTAAAWAYRLVLAAQDMDLSLWVNQFPAFLDVYANGMVAAWLFVRWQSAPGSNPTPRKALAQRALATAGACLSLHLIWRIITAQSNMSWEPSGLHLGQLLFRYPLSALAALWLLLASRSMAWFRWIFSSRLMTWLAAVSFQFYIWHQYLAVRLRFLWRFPPYAAENPNMVGEQPWQWLYTLCCFGISLLVAALLTYGLERPLSRLLQTWRPFQKKRP